MNRKSIFMGLFVALLCLTMSNSYGQLNVVQGVPVKGTACAIWDAAHNRYLYSYQDISFDVMGKPVYNVAAIYECDRKGANSQIFTQLTGQMKAPTGMFIKGNNLYVADWTRIWVVSLTDGTYVDQFMAPGGEGIQDICTDGVNTMYATDYPDSKIYWFNMTTKEFDTLVCDTNGVNQPTGIYFEASPKKSLFVCSFIPNSPIQRYDFSGDSIYTIKRTAYRFCYGIKGDGKGNYYLSDWRTTAKNGGADYKFTGGFNVANTYVNYLNFPSIMFYQPVGDTLVVTELNSGKSTLVMVSASKDLVPPECDTTLIANNKTLLVYFNEQVNATAIQKLNYTGVGTLTSVTLDASKKIVTVNLATALTLNLKTPFSVSNVQDLAGNAMKQPRTFNLIYKIQGIYDSYLNGGLSVYPNPVRNKLNIDYELLQSAPVNIELYDVMGQKVAEFFNGEQIPGEYQTSYQLPKNITNNGLYILKFTVDGNIFMSKILVNR
jgi:hypothetical protein